MFRLLLLSVFLVCLAALPALADVPPDELRAHISSPDNIVVNDERCDIGSHKNVECMVYVDQQCQVVWYVLYDKKLTVTHIMFTDLKGLWYAWIREDLSV